MLLALFFLFLILWLLGWMTSYTFGGLIHLLLLFAIIALIFRILEGRRVT